MEEVMSDSEPVKRPYNIDWAADEAAGRIPNPSVPRARVLRETEEQLAEAFHEARYFEARL
jgi:hypothetical protein